MWTDCRSHTLFRERGNIFQHGQAGKSSTQKSERGYVSFQKSYSTEVFAHLWLYELFVHYAHTLKSQAVSTPLEWQWQNKSRLLISITSIVFVCHYRASYGYIYIYMSHMWPMFLHAFKWPDITPQSNPDKSHVTNKVGGQPPVINGVCNPHKWP